MKVSSTKRRSWVRELQLLAAASLTMLIAAGWRLGKADQILTFVPHTHW